MSMYDTMEVNGEEFQTQCMGHSYRIEDGCLEQGLLSQSVNSLLSRAWGIKDPDSKIESWEMEHKWVKKDYTGTMTLTISEYQIHVEFHNGYTIESTTEELGGGIKV